MTKYPPLIALSLINYPFYNEGGVPASTRYTLEWSIGEGGGGSSNLVILSRE